MARLEVLRRLRPHRLVVDTLIALSIAILGFVGANGLTLDLGVIQHTWPLTPIVLAGTLPLALRRVVPLVPLIAATGTAFLLARSDYNMDALLLASTVALYSVGANARSQGESFAGLLVAIGATVLIWLGSSYGSDPWIFFLFGVQAGLWLVGDTLRRRAAQIVELQQHAAHLEQLREIESRRAVADERARIARELHDVVAHSVTIMVVQAEAGRKVLDAQPDAARTSLEAIENTGRQALADMRRLLGVMDRDGARATAKDPAPGLDQIDALVGEMQRAGLVVDLRVEGERGPLPPGVDLSAYRVVQEALTNALRHAGAARVSVVVRYRSDAIEVEVNDDGEGPVNDPASPGGRGLVGMRERVALFQGEFEAGPRRGGGFVVRARLPLGSSGG